MKKPEPILIVDLLAKIDRQLIYILNKLGPEHWNRKTLAAPWTVKEVAAHLLDGNLRTLSMLRDQYWGESSPESDAHADLVRYLNRLNADWVKAMKRVSPRILIQQLVASGKEYCEYLTSLDPFAPATFSVDWAGESAFFNWFHIAREYTEKWHHQQQIRLAAGVDTETLLTDYWYAPYLNASLRALPHHYRHIQGKEGAIIQFVFQGERDKYWYLKWVKDQWILLEGVKSKEYVPISEISVKDEIAWRIFTKGINKEKALQQSHIAGNPEWGQHFFHMLAVMA